MAIKVAPTPDNGETIIRQSCRHSKRIYACLFISILVSVIIIVTISVTVMKSENLSKDLNIFNDTSMVDSNPLLIDLVANRKILWSDEFDSNQLDTDKWTIDTGIGCESSMHTCGFDDDAIQSYQEKNVVLENGKLVLTAVYEDVPLPDSSRFSAARIRSSSNFNIHFGMIQAMISVSDGSGMWARMTMLPIREDYGAWPGSGEVNVMQTFNVLESEPSILRSSLNYGYPLGEGEKGESGCVYKTNESISGNYYAFSLLWTPVYMQFFINGFLYCDLSHWWAGKAIDDRRAPFNSPFQVIFSIGVGGIDPGSQINPEVNLSSLPFQMNVDYIRVYDLHASESLSTTRPVPGFVEPILANLTNPHSAYVNLSTGLHEPVFMHDFGVRIEMELFDYGGQNVGYFDVSPQQNRGDCALRLGEGVEILQDDFFQLPGTPTFSDTAGAYIRYTQGEWTAYSVYIPTLYPSWYVHVRHSTLNGGGFMLLIDSTDCRGTYESEINMLLKAENVTESRISSNIPSPELGIDPKCWQTERWKLADNLMTVGNHRLVFCSLGVNLNVQYMELFPYEPDYELQEGPGCDAPV